MNDGLTDEPRDDAEAQDAENGGEQTRTQRVRERLGGVSRKSWLAAGVTLLASAAGVVAAVAWRKRR